MKKIKNFREKVIISILLLNFILLFSAKIFVSSFYSEAELFKWDSYSNTTVGLQVIFAQSNFYHTGHYERSDCENRMLYGEDSDIAIFSGGSGSGDRKDLYPDNFRILYYSFDEKKFYAGTFKLDYDKILIIAEKIRRAVKLKEDGTERIYFKAKVYPLGKVVVSMGNYSKKSVEDVVLATFYTKQEIHDWSVFTNVLNRSDNDGVSKSKSVTIQRALFLNKYNWQINILLPKECSIKNVNVITYGDKSFGMDTIYNAKMPSYGNFIYLPHKLYISWQRKDTIRFSTGFNFDENEIIKGFETVDNKDDNLPIIMRIIIKDDSTALRAILSGNGKSIELKNIDRSKIFTYKIYK
ncbi:MAG: DUF2931 family protein [Flavobacterium sp.]